MTICFGRFDSEIFDMKKTQTNEKNVPRYFRLL